MDAKEIALKYVGHEDNIKELAQDIEAYHQEKVKEIMGEIIYTQEAAANGACPHMNVNDVLNLLEGHLKQKK